MKRLLLTLSLLALLSSCDFQSRADFEAELNGDELTTTDIDLPEITYVSDDGRQIGEEEIEDSYEENLDFVGMYGKGKLAKAISPADARGNLLDTRIVQTQIGISLIPSVQRQGAYSTILSYNKDGGLVEREFGPVAGIAGLATTVTYDMIDSESGPMLLVSQVSVSETETYSAYYLFNKFMGLMDYMVFKNSTDQVMPTVERLGDVIQWTDAAYPGSVEEAINHRMETEDKYLPDMLGTYGVKTRPLSSLVNGKETDVGYLPDITNENRILLVKTTDNPSSQGMNVDIAQ